MRKTNYAANIFILFVALTVSFLILFFFKRSLKHVSFGVKQFIDNEAHLRENDCVGKNLVYSILPSSQNFPATIGAGFNCASKPLLKRFTLTDDSPLDIITSNKNKFPQDAVFVLATSKRFYQSLRAAISSIQLIFLQNYQKIIVYDLDGLSDNSTILAELSSVCKLELRHFPFDDYPEHVRQLKSFAWKILVIADVFREYDMIVYCDTSIYFLENDFRDYFDGMKNGKLFHVQFAHAAGHGIRFATHLHMLNYLPLHPNVQEDIQMHEANLIMIKKSPASRNILKWAVLCALEMDCINPLGSKILCHVEQEFKVPYGSCHRQDQSALTILVNNAETILHEKGQTELIPHQSYQHPSFRHERHLILRGQTTENRIDSCRRRKNAGKEKSQGFMNLLFKNSGQKFRWIRLNAQYRYHRNVCSSVSNPEQYLEIAVNN